MFGQEKNNRITRSSANRTTNKILTYGLIFFIFYSVYTSNKDKPATPTPTAKIENMTPINWSCYATVHNLITDEEVFQKIDNNKLVIEFSKDDLQEIKAAGFDGKDSTPLYEVELNNGFDINTIIHKDK